MNFVKLRAWNRKLTTPPPPHPQASSTQPPKYVQIDAWSVLARNLSFTCEHLYRYRVNDEWCELLVKEEERTMLKISVMISIVSDQVKQLTPNHYFRFSKFVFIVFPHGILNYTRENYSCLRWLNLEVTFGCFSVESVLAWLLAWH